MKPGILAGIIVAVIVAVGALAFLGTREDKLTTNNTSPTQTAPPATNGASIDNEDADEEEESDQTAGGTSEAASGITMAEVGMHTSESDCWTVIEGSVYDITEYIPRHPGGEEILQACGVDGTTLFTTRTTEDGESVGSGEPHSSKAQSQLAQFKVGDLN